MLQNILDKALSLNPENVTTLRRLGKVLTLSGQHERSVETFLKVRKIRPNDFDTYIELGIAYSIAKRFDEAIEAMKKAVDINKDDVDANLYLGNYYVYTGNRKAAMIQYEILKKIDSTKAEELLVVN